MKKIIPADARGINETMRRRKSMRFEENTHQLIRYTLLHNHRHASL